jgi:ArsR family transcriptional regulator, arsenate/arsenite/antimonite-responsive transcriptional repressor
MQPFMAITRALGDESRVRILLTLRDGELCLCQLIELLELAPSTVSKHVELLRQAGLVERRKEGRWHFYRLAAGGAPPMVREAIRWVLSSLQGEGIALADAERLYTIRATDPQLLTACYGRS